MTSRWQPADAALSAARLSAGAKRVSFGTSDTRGPKPAVLEAARARSEARHSGAAKPGRKRSQSPPTLIAEPSEHQSQVAVIQWWAIHCKRWKLDERLLFSIPNAGAGASKGQAGKMKAEGTRAGVPDLFLAVPIVSDDDGIFPGCFIEMKKKSGKPEPEQASYHYLLRSQGFNVVVAHGYDEAVRAITAYCDRDNKEKR